jgi:hypothetical protein
LSFDPVMMAYLRNILEHNSPRSVQNGDQIDAINELLQQAQNENVSRQVTFRRAFRVFEIGYCLTLEQNDFRSRGWKPDPRADISNLGAYEAILQEIIDRGIVFFVEAKFEGNELKDGVEAIRKTKMSRAMKGAERMIDLAQGIRWLLTYDETVSPEPPGGLDLVGNALANTCRVMNVGLTEQVTIAKEIMRHE